jgi:hypothetical protein
LKLAYQVFFCGAAFFEGVEDVVELVFGDGAVPVVVGLDDHYGALAAQAQAGGGCYYGVEAAVSTFFGDVLQEGGGALLVAKPLSVSGNPIRVAY